MQNNLRMKKMLILGLAALLLPALVACKGGQQKAVDIDWQEGEMMAVAFLGYYDSFGAFEASPSFIPLTQAFPQIVEAKRVDCGIGREIYLVVPRDAMATLAVDEDGEYITDENREVYYRSEEGTPVLIYNNWWQGEPSSLVVCTDSEGRTTMYNPQINARTGALKTPSDGSIRDISLPMPAPMKDYTSFEYGEIYDGSSLGLSVSLRAGQPVLTCAAAPMVRLGFDEDDISLRDGDNFFDGINGRCKGVFLGDIGQDYNPVVCVVMEDGSVKMSGVFYAMLHGGPALSDALPGFKDVTGFECGGGGGYEDEDGEMIYEYGTIYALDERGGRTEIPYFVGSGTFNGMDGVHYFEATLTPDWNFSISAYHLEDGDLCEFWRGHFSEAEAGDEQMTYRFHTIYDGVYDGYELDGKDVSQTGTFTVRERDLSYEVELSGADYFKSGTLFRDERLADVDDNMYDYD